MDPINVNDDIISFSKKTSEIKGRLIGKKKKDFNLCIHTRVLADEHNKVIECASCQFIMTPWEYVLRLATREDNIFNNLKYAKMECKNLNEQSTELKKNVKNLKSQLKRVVDKIGTKTVELNKLNRL